MLDNPLVFFSAVLGLGILAQWIAWRLRFPSILMLLAVGFLMGLLCGDNPDVPGDTITDEILTPRLLFPLVALAVGVIMFEGGLTLRFHELADAGKVVLRLVTIGAACTWLLASAAAYVCLGMSLPVAALTGAILVVTGPTVIAPLLRHVRPYRRIGSIVKWEGIVIDPIGAVLAVLVFESTFHGAAVVQGLAKILIIGVAVGWLSAWLLVEFMRRYWIPDFLHNAVFLSAALSVFALSDLMVSESGLVTVTIMGVALANQKKVPVRHVVEFKENLRVLLISCLFVLLAARIQPEDIMALGWGGFAFVVLLIVVIRPLSVFCSTLGTELTWQERTFLSLLAPRGIVAAAVSSVFALEVAKHHQGHAAFPPGDDKLVTLTFLVIVTTVAIYGLSAAPLARWLGLASANPQGLLIAGASAWVRKLAQAIQEEGIDVMLIDTNYRNTAAANLEGIPARCASIVSEYMEEIDLGGIGRLLGMTPNDDLNTLAAVEFANVFGRANVFQLAHGEGNANARRRDVASPMSGRYLFDEDATYSQMAFRIAAGAVVKKTKITDEFAFADFRERYGDDAIVLFVISEHQQLLISTVEQPLEPQSGQTVIAVVNEK